MDCGLHTDRMQQSRYMFFQQIISRVIFNENFGENCNSLGSLSQQGIHNKKDASDRVFISCIS